MKTQFIASTLIALATIASSSAFAGTYAPSVEADAVVNTAAVSTLTRAEVDRDTALWNKTNFSNNLESVAVVDEGFVPTTTFVSKVSRDDVKTETALWNKTHYSTNLESVTVTDSN